MRHRKRTDKLSRTSSHRQAMIVNMLKSLIEHGRIETTLAKAKVLRRHADHMVTLAKDPSLASRRRAVAALRIRYNKLTPQDQKPNVDRTVIEKLYSVLGPRFANRNGGYTRLVRLGQRVGDASMRCAIEYIAE
jgi:large subunit ribosomal protein L17